MERLRVRPRQATHKNPPCDRQRRWRLRMDQDPDRVVDTIDKLLYKIDRSIRVLAVARNKSEVKQHLRHLYKTLRDIVNAGIVEMDDELQHMIQLLDTIFYKH